MLVFLQRFFINFLHYRDKEVNQSPRFQLPLPTPQLLKITLDPTQTLFLTKQVSGDFFYFWMILLWQQLQMSSPVAVSQTWTQVSCWIAEACPQGPLNTVPSRDVHKRSFINSRRQATNHFNNYCVLKKGAQHIYYEGNSKDLNLFGIFIGPTPSCCWDLTDLTLAC